MNQLENWDRPDRAAELRNDAFGKGYHWGDAIQGTSSDERKASLYKYLKDRQGKSLRIKDISSDLGYKSLNGCRHQLLRLLEEGEIRVRKGKGPNYRFYLTRLETSKNLDKNLTKLDKGDERNSEVVVTHVPTKPQSKSQPKPQPESTVSEFESYDPKSATGQTKTPNSVEKTNEQTFVEILDLAIWEFLKTYDPKDAQYKNTALGEVTQGLREFSTYMKKRATEELRENTSEEKNEPRS